MLLRAAGLLVLWVGALDEFVGWFPGRVPLDHLSSANLAISAAAVGNGQLDSAYYVQCAAMSTGKFAAMILEGSSGCRGLVEPRTGIG
jgi:hypothetical protein